MEEEAVDFLLHWPQTIKSDSLTKEDIINKSNFVEFLSKFSKLLRWRQQNAGDVNETVLSQMLCYTDQLLLVFNSANACVQLQAAKLLVEDEFRVLGRIMKLSLEKLDAREMSNTMAFNRSLLLVECSMLNCLSTFPLSEFTSDSVKLILSLLYSHLEDFPNIAGSHGSVMWISIQSVIDTVYHLLSFSASLPSVVPSTACIKTIESVAVCAIQMLKISAKAVLSKFYHCPLHVQIKSLMLDDIEIQTFLNFLQAEPHYTKAIIFPMYQYMKDVLILDQNRLAFIQWNALAILVDIKVKHKDPTVLTMLDDLIYTLAKPVASLDRRNTEESDRENVTLDDDNDESVDSVDAFDHLTSKCYSSFDLFVCAMKHFVIYTREILHGSGELTCFVIKSVTITLGFVRDMMSINQDTSSKIVTFMAQNPACLSSIVEFINHWRLLIEFPHFGNAVYGILMTGSNDDKFCFELGRSGFLFWILSFLNIGVMTDMLQFGDIGHLIGNLIVVFNCAQRPQLLYALEMVSTFTVLPLYAQCTDLRLRMLAKFTLSYMDFALFDASIMELSTAEVEYIKDQLMEAVDKGSTSHWYEHCEVLQVLINLIRCSPKNAKMIIQFNSVMDLLIKSMCSGNPLVQKISVEGFMYLHSWYRLLTDGQVSQSKHAIEVLSAHEDSGIKNLGACAQFLLEPDTAKSPEMLVQLIESCYKCKLYEKSIELASVPSIANNNQAYLLKAKCLYNLYRREHEYLCRHYELLSRQVADQKTDSCYSKAEECIRLLSILLDNEAIDPEGSRMLDQAMLDYIYKTNKLNKLRRCLLCQTKSNLKRSHLWPKSFLRRYSLQTKGDFSSRIFVFCIPQCYKEKSPGELTYWMLCGKCEQRLSQNGEDKFSTDLFDQISHGSDKTDDAHVSYGPWLYNFMIGMLFRSFIFFDLSAEKYSIFLHCRHHLLSLPVKYSQEQNNPSNDTENSNTMKDLINPTDSHTDTAQTETDFLSPFLLVNPTKIDVDHARKSMLVRALFDAGSAKIADCSLLTGKRDLSGQYHFITIRLGNLNFLLKLEASTDYIPPPGSVITPSGGKLLVPAEKNRWDYIPEGLWIVIDKVAELVESTSLRHYAYKVSAGTWKPLDSPEMQQIPSEEDSEKERMMHSLLKQKSNDAYSSFISRFLQESQPSLSFLPEGYKFIQKYSQTHKPHLQLPVGHRIIYHITLNFLEANLTTFLVAYYDVVPKFIAIIIERIQGVQLAYGAHVESDSEHNVSLDKPLIDLAKISDHHRARFNHYCTEIGKLFSLLLKVKRVYRLEVLIQRISCTKAEHYLMSLQPVDLKCVDNRECWYCEDRCQHCLQPASLGYSMRKVEQGITKVIKFCKVNPCYSFYTSSPIAMPTFVHPLPHDSPEAELLLQVTKLIGTGWSSNTILVVQLCINKKSFDIHKGKLYVLMQFHTASSQGFFDFFITMDYKPVEVLWYMKDKQSMIMGNSTLFMLMLKLIIENALEATPYYHLDGLLQADQLRSYSSDSKQATASEVKKESTNDIDEISSLFQSY